MNAAEAGARQPTERRVPVRATMSRATALELRTIAPDLIDELYTSLDGVPIVLDDFAPQTAVLFEYPPLDAPRSAVMTKGQAMLAVTWIREALRILPG